MNIFFLKIPSDWKNPSRNYHIGIKSLKQLIPSTAFDRLTVNIIQRKKTFYFFILNSFLERLS